MSCWRLLELSDASDSRIPQLLIKTDFGTKHYTVFLTDSDNIWSEDLDLTAIVERASQQESPIEVSKQDTAQLAILLDHVRKSLASADKTTCCITRDGADGVTLHATTSLPGPLDSLRWKFYLRKRTSTTLKNELILPLLVSSHIQHERINSLISSVAEKDKAITRLLDQFESNNLDLATAFPSIGGSKSGRRLIKREQAARHVPALQAFDEDAWKTDTAQLKDSQISTLGLFQEALSECNPKVPPRMNAKEDVSWWTSIGSNLSSPKANRELNSEKPAKARALITPQSEPSEDETEDDFETHEHFNLRELPKEVPEPTLSSVQNVPADNEDESTEEEGDLNTPLRSQRQSQSRAFTKTSSATAISPESKQTFPRKSTSSIIQKPQGFRIGGAKSKKLVVEPPPPTSSMDTDNVAKEDDDTNVDATVRTGRSASVEPTASTAVKATRKPFKIGGKHKADIETSDISPSTRASSSKGDTVTLKEPSVEPISREKMPAVKAEVEGILAEEHEETPEEKAERRRQELKRKNEELAKKQAQNKKKKRF